MRFNKWRLVLINLRKCYLSKIKIVNFARQSREGRKTAPYLTNYFRKKSLWKFFLRMSSPICANIYLAEYISVCDYISHKLRIFADAKDSIVLEEAKSSILPNIAFRNKYSFT